MRIVLALVMFAAGSALLGAAVAKGEGSVVAIRAGGSFRVVLHPSTLDSVDPALAYTVGGWALLDATCAKLMNFPDKPAPAGTRLIPEVAAAYPRVSRDARTFTFTLRRNFRFSTNQAVRPSSFARAIARILALGRNTPARVHVLDIVGAGDVSPGQVRVPTGVEIRGNRLTVRLTRPSPDFPARMTMPFFCAVPPALPSNPEGLATYPGSGPYYVAQNVRGRRVVLRQNRFYRGTRPHHVASIVVTHDVAGDDLILDRIEQGRADWGIPSRSPAYFDRGLPSKYGLNKSRFFLRPGRSFRLYLFNLSRPLFRKNVRLRRAVNFAVDRAAIRRQLGGHFFSRLTDQYLPPGLGGFRDARIYPLNGPNVRRARQLARGRTRSGRAVIYTFDVPSVVAGAQIVQRNLATIGLIAELRVFPFSVYYDRLDNPGEPWDLAAFGWAPDYLDPFQYLNALLDARAIPFGGNLGRFDSLRFNRLLKRAGNLRGAKRYEAYGELDVRLARDAAPLVALGFENEPTFFSRRVDRRCVVLRPLLDLAAVCLKR